jgi:hypothetical protein
MVFVVFMCAPSGTAVVRLMLAHDNSEATTLLTRILVERGPAD